MDGVKKEGALQLIGAVGSNLFFQDLKIFMTKSITEIPKVFKRKNALYVWEITLNEKIAVLLWMIFIITVPSFYKN